MAPEVMERSGHDFKADIWSLGLTAIEICLGNAPYSNLTAGKIMLNILKNPSP